MHPNLEPEWCVSHLGKTPRNLQFLRMLLESLGRQYGCQWREKPRLFLPCRKNTLGRVRSADGKIPAEATWADRVIPKHTCPFREFGEWRCRRWRKKDSFFLEWRSLFLRKGEVVVHSRRAYLDKRQRPCFKRGDSKLEKKGE